MARVLIDTCVFGQSWFVKVVEDLISNPKVRFAYTPHGKMTQEHNLKLASFYKRLGDIKRRDDVPERAAERHIKALETSETWKSEEACDDPHIFAVVRELPTPFVFTSDTRIAKCRTCMQRVIDSRYCDFRLISRKANYDEKRAEIHS